MSYDPAPGSGPGPQSVASFTYDPAMRETQRDLGNGLTRTTAYARQDHLPTAMTVADPAGGPSGARPGLSWSSYIYDPNKNLATAVTGIPGGVMNPYSFSTVQDAEDRTTEWARDLPGGNGENQLWTLTDVGDWSTYDGDELAPGSSGTLNAFSETRTHNAVHEIQTIDDGTVTTLLHDPKGNLTRDEEGQVYIWDFDNRLTEARDSVGNLLGTYAYDALGRRVSKTVYTPGSGSMTSVTINFVHLTDDSGMGQLLAEYETNTLKRLYTYGPYIDEPLTLERFDASLPIGNEVLFVHRDRQYNLIGLTDASGVVTERYTYTPYGERRILDPDGTTVRQTSAVGNPLGHQGLYHDEETGLIYNRARYRNAGLGRWLGRDPLGYADGLSMYNYLPGLYDAKNDPSGLLASGCDCPCESPTGGKNCGGKRRFARVSTCLNNTTLLVYIQITCFCHFKDKYLMWFDGGSTIVLVPVSGCYAIYPKDTAEMKRETKKWGCNVLGI